MKEACGTEELQSGGGKGLRDRFKDREGKEERQEKTSKERREGKKGKTRMRLKREDWKRGARRKLKESTD